MLSSAKTDHVINVRITHKTAHVPLMEAVAFKEKEKALAELRSLENVEECLILQTCNRIELFIVTEAAEKTAEVAKDYLAKRAGANAEEASKAIEISIDNDTFNHLLQSHLRLRIHGYRRRPSSQTKSGTPIWKRITPKPSDQS